MLVEAQHGLEVVGWTGDAKMRGSGHAGEGIGVYSPSTPIDTGLLYF